MSSQPLDQTYELGGLSCDVTWEEIEATNKALIEQAFLMVENQSKEIDRILKELGYN